MINDLIGLWGNETTNQFLKPNAFSLLISQSLVLSFLHLMNTQLQMTLDFLSSVPDPTGKSALEYVIKIWCARQTEFFGVYDSKVR